MVYSPEMRTARGLIREKRKWTDLIRCVTLEHSSKEPDQIPTVPSSVFSPGVVRNRSMLFSFIPPIPLLGLFQAEDVFSCADTWHLTASLGVTLQSTLLVCLVPLSVLFCSSVSPWENDILCSLNTSLAQLLKRESRDVSVCSTKTDDIGEN